MPQISEHFHTDEFACQCGCGFGEKQEHIDVRLLSLLELIRSSVGGPIRLKSGCRCETHNSAVGGVPNSTHTLGEAADIRVEGGWHRFMVQRAAHAHGAEGVGTAKGFIHVDVHKGAVKPRPSAWSY